MRGAHLRAGGEMERARNVRTYNGSSCPWYFEKIRRWTRASRCSPIRAGACTPLPVERDSRFP